jgi:hypothetical protein
MYCIGHRLFYTLVIETLVGEMDIPYRAKGIPLKKFRTPLELYFFRKIFPLAREIRGVKYCTYIPGRTLFFKIFVWKNLKCPRLPLPDPPPQKKKNTFNIILVSIPWNHLSISWDYSFFIAIFFKETVSREFRPSGFFVKRYPWVPWFMG